MILLLHSLIEAIVALLFLFHPGADQLVPGFDTGSGASYVLTLKMYGLAALLLAALSLVAYQKRTEDAIFLPITLLLSVFHFGMCLIQAIYNPDHRAFLLHFLLALFLSGQYIQRWRKEEIAGE